MNEKNGSKNPKKIIIGIVALMVVVAAVIGIYIYKSYSQNFVATIGSEKVTKEEFSFSLAQTKNDMLKEAKNPDPNVFWKTKIEGEDALSVAKKKALESIREHKVQLIKAKQDKSIVLAKADTDQIDQMINGLIEKYKTKAEADKVLKENLGVDIDNLKDLLKEQSLVDKFKQKKMSQIQIADKDAKDYYDKHLEEYKNGQFRENAEEAVWVKHILIPIKDLQTQADYPKDKQEQAKKQAETVLARAKKGEDFAKLAKEFSQDTGSANYGGDYVFGKGKMAPEFEKASFELNPGEVSGLVKTEFGYHIIKLEEKVPQGQPVSLKCAKEYWELSAIEKIRNAKYQDEVNKMKNEFKVSINQSVYSKMEK